MKQRNPSSEECSCVHSSQTASISENSGPGNVSGGGGSTTLVEMLTHTVHNARKCVRVCGVASL